MDRVAIAVARARELEEIEVDTPANDDRARTRWLAVGDPQAPLARFLEVLDRAEALGEDGRLRPDVGILSIGDHFDFGVDAARAARDGLAILHWLASHPPDQVVLLAGNHDVARVTELAFETDGEFAEARAFEGDAAAFHARFPRIPTKEIAARDYSGFTERQRASVQRLLLARRFALAAVAPLDGSPTLFVHAGVTTRELSLLGVEAEPGPIAAALNAFLDARVSRVADVWSRGELAALDLEPLHIAGAAGVEGGGLLYHRAANLERDDMSDPAWERDTARPRRYDPRTLPRGLAQVVGHTSHKKCVKVLKPWVTARACGVANGGLRTLRAGESIVYDVGIHPPAPEHAVVYMIDGSMSDEDIAEYPLLPIGAPEVTRGSV